MKKTLIISSMLALGMVSSCSESFLDVKPTGVASLEQVTNKSGVNALLIGAYSLLDGIGSGTTNWHAAISNWVYGGVASDDAYKGTDAGDQPEISFIERYEALPNMVHMRGKWTHSYDGVARSNDVLQALPQVKDMTEAEKVQATAEARFLRGHYHFEAKRMWNMVPYIDEKTYDPSNPNSTKLTNDKNIWPNIEADFKFAMDNLPVSQSQRGRATRFAAMAYLARTYLHQQKYADAKPLLDAIVNSGRFRLVDFHDNFRAATNNNAESVFEVQFSVNDGTNGGNGNAGDELNWPYFSSAPGGGCCGFYQPSHNLVNAFKTDANGLPLFDTFDNVDLKNDMGVAASAAFDPDRTTPLDPRLDWTVGRRGVPFLDWGIMPGVTWIRDQQYAGPYTGKKWMYYRSEEGTNTHSTNKRRLANNFRLIRYASVLLWLAECEVEVGSLQRARELVNMIRKRAKESRPVTLADGTPAANYVINEYPANSPLFAAKDAARSAVRFETRLEFAMEGHRFFDLVRWGVADQVLNAYLRSESRRRQYLNGAVFTKGKSEYFPLPIDEITNSFVNGQPTLKQNPGY